MPPERRALSPNEQAFEYLMFVLSSCAVGGAPIINSAPPPPPTATALSPVSFTRDYHAVCPSDGGPTRPVWRVFSYTAEVPTGTSIVVSAQTAADATGSPGTYGATVPVGTVSATTGTIPVPLPASMMTVDTLLRAAVPVQVSQDWLRLTMTLNPTGTTSPVLEQWVMTYDCVAAE